MASSILSSSECAPPAWGVASKRSREAGPPHKEGHPFAATARSPSIEWACRPGKSRSRGCGAVQLGEGDTGRLRQGAFPKHHCRHFTLVSEALLSSSWSLLL